MAVRFFSYDGEDRIRREDIPLFDPDNALHREIAKLSAAALAELLPIVPKMELPVAGKLALLDTLTPRLLGSASGAPRRQKASKSQGDLLLD